MMKHTLTLKDDKVIVTSSFEGFKIRSQFKNADPSENSVWANRMMALNEDTLNKAHDYRNYPIHLVDADGNVKPMKCQLER